MGRQNLIRGRQLVGGVFPHLSLARQNVSQLTWLAVAGRF